MKIQFHSAVRLFIVALAGALLAGCSDLGNNPADANQGTPNPPAQTQEISFQIRVKPIFQSYGCTSCHGTSGGISVQTVAQLLQGGDHGPSVVAGNADGSILIRKLQTSPPFGSRMPQGGPYLPDSTLQVVKLWISQGAKNN